MASLYFLKPIKASKVSIRERERERDLLREQENCRIHQHQWLVDRL
ncbi:unnamed protein product [Brassica rapa]|uniref:Uncharacterized protein n=2 Tax=Brassica TaxID=3705 RepID=A0A8D9D9W6_BRACM|nr:unnamed protein product [Brassica napus]CAG7870027.1 unnamed protein product [Brassica rapa]